MLETQESSVQSLGQEYSLEEKMATHSSILAWEIPWTEEPGGPQSMGLQRVRHDCMTLWATKHARMHQTVMIKDSRNFLGGGRGVGRVVWQGKQSFSALSLKTFSFVWLFTQGEGSGTTVVSLVDAEAFWFSHFSYHLNDRLTMKKGEESEYLKSAEKLRANKLFVNSRNGNAVENLVQFQINVK